ncbi:MAG: 3-hydroxyacyl-CoA dehydrogenase family protein [Desulfobacterales bacterium]|nr:3-hydroxyacyl-CoA dehydrogenase family protein [Deltaproteobacteria bacterium]NNK92910.1 3-hydroxyacyl-CoA dehydrogenase family protein [Desulfobacterales bacterium]
MIHHVMVVGYGIMGQGIAISFARGGHQVTVLSRNPRRIDALPDGVDAVGELPADPPDLIIEAVPERLELKISLFARLEKAYGDLPILATNTSGLSLEAMAAELQYPHQFIGIHYFQPAEMLPSVEVMLVEQTDQTTLQRVTEALSRNGQQAVIIKRPIAGYLANRLQHAMLHEAFSMIEQGVVSAEDVDRVCKTMFGPRMCVTGLLEQKDISGLATTAAAQQALVPQLNHSGTPTRLIQDMIARGQLGVKSGTGFYDWNNRDIAAYKKEAMKKLVKILEIISEN